MYQENTFQIQNTYFVFLVPTEWTDILDKLELAIVPILERAGIVISNTEEKLTFITQLEALVTFKQLHPYRKNIPTTFKQRIDVSYTIYISKRIM